jgi:DNA-directed RNA polymerase specialized sigma24 family protein
VRDTFLRVWRSARRFDDKVSVAAWIVRAALRVGSLGPSLYAVEGPDPEAESGPDGIVAGRASADDLTPELVTFLEERLAALPRGPRLAAALVEREGMNELDVAQALDVSVPDVWRWVGEARWALAPDTPKRPRFRRLARVGRAVRTGRVCPPPWKLVRSVSVEVVPRVGWHLSACMVCARDFALLDGVSERLASLPRHEMSDAARDAVAVSLLAAPLG